MLYVVYPILLFGAVFIIIAAAIYRRYWHLVPHYRMPYVSVLRDYYHIVVSNYTRSYFFWIIRPLALFLLALAIAHTRDVDEQSRIQVDGSDIMLLFDVSGSMQLFDDMHDRRSRFDVAKKEILSFIEQRSCDPIGLILFGATAVSRCPVTLDKKILQTIVADISLGDIAHNSTLLGVALSMGVNRLRTSKAKSKIIIMLTDGAPSEGDIPLEPVIELAKKHGIKVYTIGVGGSEGGYVVVPMHGLVRCETPLNSEILGAIAEQTGGAFFRAEKPADIKRVYETIDALEKTAYEVPLYTTYYDFGIPLIMVVIILLALEVSIICWRRII